MAQRQRGRFFLSLIIEAVKTCLTGRCRRISVCTISICVRSGFGLDASLNSWLECHGVSEETQADREERQGETALLEKLHAGCLVHSTECRSGRVSNREDKTHT